MNFAKFFIIDNCRLLGFISIHNNILFIALATSLAVFMLTGSTQTNILIRLFTSKICLKFHYFWQHFNQICLNKITETFYDNSTSLKTG